MDQSTFSRFDLIGRALRLELLPQERLVLVALVQRMRTSGKQARLAWPKIDQLSDDLGGMPRRNVRRHLDALERGGHIQRWRQRNSYLYRIPPTWDEVAVSARRVRLRTPSTPREIESWE